MRDVVVVVVVW